MTTWLEVSLLVNGELAEAVADVLARFAPNGVVTESTGVKYVDEENIGVTVGPISVRAYLEVNDQIEETRQKLEEALFYLGMIQPLPAPVYKQIADRNWMEAWKEHYKPIPIGKRLMIVPAWMDSPEPSRIAIRIDPGMAFGTGTHPTTQLCLELIEEFMKERRKTKENSSFIFHLSSLIDIGCGSGILSIAALKLGATRALGVDIDIESVRNSRENADKNGIGAELILGQGSVAEVKAGRFAFASAPLVVANILAPVIIRLFEAGLGDLVEAGGAVILSGILSGQAEKVREAAQAKGLVLTGQRQMGDWVALAMSRP
ncbi:MAG: 50S ribosomal protein L11 methyltransferase [Anaerolineae bacterium CG03_land_8_20_14_0_80_58_20]|nr:MAG: 50S ribosomal protein L11 methyltransferase [Anaerolineae bacterium CG03_land_8_20_14_0_80_58_20]